MPNPRLKAHWPSNRWGFDEQHDGCNQAEALAVFCLLGMSLEAVDGEVGAAGWDVVARRQSPLRARRAGSDWAPTAIQSQRAAGVGGQNATSWTAAWNPERSDCLKLRLNSWLWDLRSFSSRTHQFSVKRMDQWSSLLGGYFVPPLTTHTVRPSAGYDARLRQWILAVFVNNFKLSARLFASKQRFVNGIAMRYCVQTSDIDSILLSFSILKFSPALRSIRINSLTEVLQVVSLNLEFQLLERSFSYIATALSPIFNKLLLEASAALTPFTPAQTPR
ncbi:hypothetical protein CIHG_10404 [Coccidioides immitis H538.4]|uniref:Uncharacterized protein n=3 Tax=Coccidioides immitis TaxID=5501 RepID=A0A0J8RB77_COCIT|nr:hypothetical protein CIRG_09190 [Coccidioides immitis RMSCC 2394]KMU81148.1 hypothetical protein CISG_02525 [Coccidioides immitis RMSCC 3703]KMU92579.1 hypothetical protein CIHG_10404 [Coccidioides immitis H538.4]